MSARLTLSLITLTLVLFVSGCDSRDTKFDMPSGSEEGASGDSAEGSLSGQDAAGATDSAWTGEESAESTATPPQEGSREVGAEGWSASTEDVESPTPWDDAAVADEGAGPEDAIAPEDESSESEPVSDPMEVGDVAFEVTTQTEVLMVDGGSEEVFSVLYMPEGEGPFPLVIFSHGFQLAPTDYASYGEHLASWGYIALLPQLPGGLFGGPSHMDHKRTVSALLDWALGDGTPLSGKVNPEQIGLAGHSMGGKISMLLATTDPRIEAVFGVDPVDSAGGPMPVDSADFPSVTPELMDDITASLALVGETTNGGGDGALLGQACAPSEDNFQAYYEHATSPAIEIDVLGASHMSFLDDPDCGFACLVCPAGSDDPATTRMLTQRYMVAFFHATLLGKAGYLDYLDGDAMAVDIAQGLVAVRTKNGF